MQLLTLTAYSKEKLYSFFKSAQNNADAKDQLSVIDNAKGNAVLSVLILTAFFALMVPLSSTVIRFFNPTEKMLIVNFKYISSPQEYEQSTSQAKHMQTLSPVVKKRSPVTLKIFSAADKSLLYEKEYTARGWRQDIAMFIYTQLIIEEDYVDIELTETAFPDKQFRLNKIAIKK